MHPPTNQRPCAIIRHHELFFFPIAKATTIIEKCLVALLNTHYKVKGKILRPIA